MLFYNLPDPWEGQTQTTPQLIPIHPPPNTAEFTVKPSGEVQVKGNPDPEIIRQLLTSADYQQDQNRRHETAIRSQQQMAEMMIIGIFGATFLLVLISLFISFNQRRDNQEINNNGQSIRRISCEQIR
ncbi:MAG: hypothetical protein ACKOQ2_09560 [Dolichospermum sp.]